MKLLHGIMLLGTALCLTISGTALGVLLLVSSAVLIIIFVKHIEPLKELISEIQTNRKIKK